MKKVEDYVRSIPDFPEKGIIFRDITTVIQSPEGLKLAIDGINEKLKGVDYDVVVGPESRGFIFGVPVAYANGKGFVPVRKKGKLPCETISQDYELEYGTATIEMHKDAIVPGQKVVIVDDLIATGGTTEAIIKLIEQLGGEVVKIIFLKSALVGFSDRMQPLFGYGRGDVMPTPHNTANTGDIAKTVIMPGDPLRAKYIADTYLDNVVRFNNVRNIYGYTGVYRDVDISVMASGMGMPSMGIYSYELFKYYDVDNIIRIGSAGSISDKVDLRDIVLAIGTSTDSNYAKQYNLPGTYAPVADFGLLNCAYEQSKLYGIAAEVGNVVSTDVFYNDNPEYNKAWSNMGVLAVEMESAALYMNAARLSKNALAMFTISDNLMNGQSLSVEERQEGFDDMIKLSLETARLYNIGGGV